VTQHLNVLFLAAEAEPFVKVGGLGDVAGALPLALRAMNSSAASPATADVRLVLPLHPAIKPGEHDLRLMPGFAVKHGRTSTLVRVLWCKLDGMPTYFLDAAPIAESGSVYASDPGADGRKYLFFSLAALELARQLNWPVDVVHANDWHTAAAVYALRLRQRDGEFVNTASLLTLHNLAFMGPDLTATLEEYGLRRVETGLPAWAASRPLPLGLWAADALVAVSPTYAREIQTPAGGSGLDPFLRARRDSIHGILNGINVDSYNPALDPALASNFGIPTLGQRGANKVALQQALDLPASPAVPMFGVVSRIDPQKGTDMLPGAFRRIRDLEWQLVILGSGQARIEQSLLRLQKEFPDRVRAQIRFEPDLARRIYAGADALLMPSRYEPCGLAQMIAMRYGCVPVVSKAGGLVDTVSDTITGIVMGPATTARLAAALKRTLGIFKDAASWTTLQRAGMSQDFSWSKAAGEYLTLYASLRRAKPASPVALG